MADVTISQLTNTTPTTNSILPISKDGVTLSTTLAQLSSLPFIPKAWVNFTGRNPQISALPIPSNVGFTSQAGSRRFTITNWTSWIRSGYNTCPWLNTLYLFPTFNNIANKGPGGLNIGTIYSRLIECLSNSSVVMELIEGPSTNISETITTGSNDSTFFQTGIRSQYNISSIKTNSLGQYTITFTTPMNNNFYSVLATPGDQSPLLTDDAIICTVTNKKTTSFDLLIGYAVSSGERTFYDYDDVNISVLGT